MPPSLIFSLEQLYLQACAIRRATLMAAFLPDSTKIIYSVHLPWTPLFWDNANDTGGNLVLVTIKGGAGTPEVLVKGETRDPCVSFDGNRVLYAFRDVANGKKSYHLYEMDLKTRAIRQITSGDFYPDPRHNSDVDGIYLPNGDIMFCSTRIIQMGDCVDDRSVTANLFLCNKDGKYLRRISYDQAHICYPSVLASGEVIYCRWDYNDKCHTYAHGLFIMNPDGTRQREYYGNNSWWPTALYYPRQIPGSNKVMAIVGSYHYPQWSIDWYQAGFVATVDRNVGIANGAGIMLLAPKRLPKDDTLGTWGKDLDGLSLSAYRAKWGPYAFDSAIFPKPKAFPNDSYVLGPYSRPWPIDENNLLVCTSGYTYGLYFMTSAGLKELIVPGLCSTPVMVAPRLKPPVLTGGTDWSKSVGICQIMDIYITQDPLLKNIPRGTIKRLRVAAIDYRTGPDSGRSFMGGGPGSINFGGATTPDPIAPQAASWDIKKIIGETVVESDGSASFYVPARTPVFFQAIDSLGHLVQTMRSWATLMPGENNTCMGCHESKLKAVPPLTYTPIAIKRGPLPLDTFYGPARGFSFIKEIQPILNAKCVSCHSASTPNGIDLSADLFRFPGDVTQRTTTRGYLNLVQTTTPGDYRGKYVWWQSGEDSPLLQPPYRTGSSKSPLIKMLEAGHKDVVLTKREHDKICCWIDLGVPSPGSYTEGLSPAPLKKARIQQRIDQETREKQNIAAMLIDFPPVGQIQPGIMPDRELAMLKADFNPFFKTTVLSFSLSRMERANARWSLTLYTSAGRFVRKIADGALTAGIHRVRLDFDEGNGKKLGTGAYLCVLRAPGVMRSIKLIHIQ